MQKHPKKPQSRIIHPSLQAVFCFVLFCFVTREGEEERRGTSSLRLMSRAWFRLEEGPGTVSVAALRVKSWAGTAQSSMRDGDLSLPCFCFCNTQFSLVARIGRRDGVLSCPLPVGPGELFIVVLLLPGACWTLEQLGWGRCSQSCRTLVGRRAGKGQVASSFCSGNENSVRAAGFSCVFSSGIWLPSVLTCLVASTYHPQLQRQVKHNKRPPMFIILEHLMIKDLMTFI